MSTSDEYSDDYCQKLSNLSGSLNTSTSLQELIQANLSVSTPLQLFGSHHQENRQNTNFGWEAALAFSEDRTPLIASNLSPLIIPNPSIRSEHSILRKDRKETLDIPRPYSKTFNNTSELTQQLSPLSCVFKREWFRTCDDDTTGAVDIIAIIRQCLDSDKVKQRKPMELSSIMDSAKLNGYQQGKVLEIRRKMMRQKTAHLKRESLSRII